MVALQILMLVDPFMNSLLIYHLNIFLNKLSWNRLEEGIYWIYALLAIQTKLSSVITTWIQ